MMNALRRAVGFRALTQQFSPGRIGGGMRGMATETEAMKAILVEELGASHVEVEDVSGGCGAMFRILCVSDEFEGLSRLKQARLAQKALADNISKMHGLTLKTMTVAEFERTKQ
eukprot:g2799.t1